MSTASQHFIKVILPGLVGNVLEWYDFAIYGYLAPIISHLFFPTDDKTLSLIVTFAVFAVGFLMRPLGGLLFGYYGDRYGRKNSLAAAVLLMTIPTTLMGCLPTYQHIGITASLLMIACRLLQGLAVGGEFTGSMVYIIEHAPEQRRGFFGGLAMTSPFVGLLLGSAVAALVGWAAGPSQFHSNLWRAPFLASIILGFVGLYLRAKMPQSPIYNKIKQAGLISKRPIREAFQYHRAAMLQATVLVILPSMAFYLSFVYLSTYLHQYFQISLDHALVANSVSMAGIIIVMPFIGWLSDYTGRKPLFIVGALSFALFSLPLYLLLQKPSLTTIVIVQTCFAVLIAISYAAVPATLVELFPTHVRYTALSFPYNLANALVGGTAPLVATSLIKWTGSLLAPAGYLIVIALIVSISATWFKETKNTQL